MLVFFVKQQLMMSEFDSPPWCTKFAKAAVVAFNEPPVFNTLDGQPEGGKTMPPDLPC